MTSKKTILLATFIAFLFIAGLAFQDGPNSGSSTQPALQAASADSSGTGQITGRILFEGTKPKLEPIDMSKDPVCATRHREAVYPQDGAVNANGTLQNVFVYVKAGAEKYSGALPPQPAILDQRGCVYHPHVLGIMVGQKLEVVSSDPTTHNVHPLPKLNQEWNQSQPPGAAPIVKTFTHPEIMIPVKCNQHPWMHAYIGVTRNPFYAVTGNDGTFVLKGLPPGQYTLATWTATFGTQEQRVTVRPGESTTVNFTFKAP